MTLFGHGSRPEHALHPHPHDPQASTSGGRSIPPPLPPRAGPSPKASARRLPPPLPPGPPPPRPDQRRRLPPPIPGTAPGAPAPPPVPPAPARTSPSTAPKPQSPTLLASLGPLPTPPNFGPPPVPPRASAQTSGPGSGAPTAPALSRPPGPAQSVPAPPSPRPEHPAQAQRGPESRHNWEAVDDGDPDQPPPPPYSETAAGGEQVLDELRVPDAAAPRRPQASSPVTPPLTDAAYGGIGQPLPVPPSLQPNAPQPEQRRLGYLNSAARHWSEALPPIDARRRGP